MIITELSSFCSDIYSALYIFSEMIPLNFYGSSHISAKHGLQEALRTSVDQMDSFFRLKFKIENMVGFPGGTYYKEDDLATFYNISEQISTQEDYMGQINIIILGE